MVAVTSFIVLIGWVSGIDQLKSVLVGLPTMKVNTALMILSAAVSLLASLSSSKSSAARRISIALAVLILLTALTTLSEYWFSCDLGIDQFLIHDPKTSGRMAPATALNLCLVGFALLSVNNQKTRHQPSSRFSLFQIFGLMNSFLAFVAILGYLFGVRSLYQIAAYSSMAIHTAICLAFLGLGILFARPDLGIMTVISADTLGGKIARRLITISIIVPVVVSWFRLWGQKQGLYETEFGLAMLTTVDVLIFALVSWWLSWGIHKIDLERRLVHAEMVLVKNNLEATVTERTAELRLANEELQKRAKELARSNTELEEFAYVASHDLKEPLRMVVSYSELLVARYKEKLAPDADDFLGFILDGAKRMQRLIHDLLEYARIRTIDTRFEQVDMQRVLADALRNLGHSIEASKTVVSFDAMPVVLGEEPLLRQLLQNLVANAIKYNESASPHIHISSQKTASGSDQHPFLFSVKDDGIGIDPANKDKIFVLFQRLHGREEYDGTGIGLSICKKIVDYHGGKIWVDCNPGQGSTFFFTLSDARPQST